MKKLYRRTSIWIFSMLAGSLANVYENTVAHMESITMVSPC